MAKFGDMTLEELMDDIESAFEEMMTMLKDDYKEEDALREVKRMMAALSKILEDVGKTFHRAGSSLKGKPGKVVTEASIAYLKNAHEMKRPLKEFQAAEDLFRDVIQTCIKHTKKIDKCLKDDDDTTQKTIRRTMRQVLVRMKQQADEARSKKEKADRKK